MTRALLASLALVLGLLATARPAAAGKSTIAVLGLEVVEDGSGLDAKATQFAKELTDELRKRARGGVGPYALAPGSDKDLIELKLVSGCEDEGRECMAAIGADLATDRMLYGKVEKREKGYQVSLRLLNVATKASERSATEVIPFDEATGGGLTKWSKRLYGQMVGAGDQGTLLITVNAPAGVVRIDGQIKGNISGGKARIAGLAAGSYKLEIQADGFDAYATTIEVEGGAETPVEATLTKTAPAGSGSAAVTPPTPTPTPLPSTVTGAVSSDARPGGTQRALFWTSVVIAAGSATGMTVLGLKVRGADEDAKDDAIRAWQDAAGQQLDLDDACGDASDRLAGDAPNRMLLEDVDAACRTGKRDALLTNVLAGTTAAAAIAAVYFYYKGFVASKAPREGVAAARRRSSAPRVTVLPTFAPSTVGAGMRIDF